MAATTEKSPLGSSKTEFKAISVNPVARGVIKMFILSLNIGTSGIFGAVQF